MSSVQEPHLHLEVGHILFVDIVGYSKLLADEQKELVQELNQTVRETEQFRAAEAAGKLTRLPTGDGMVLVFTNNPEAPVECALEITKALQSHPKLKVRMGIHSGPVNPFADVNDQSNLAGAGINVAQRVMYCGDAGHILLSKHFAEDLEHYAHWRSHLHDVGEVTGKHGLRVPLVNFYTDQLGNSALPAKLRQVRAAFRFKSGVVAALLLTAALGVAFWTARRSQEKFMTAPAVPEKSIAVLPFENRSEDKANAYFADGIHDEILIRLSKIADLKVISRTSTQHYKSAPENLKEIARQLGVAHIVEGSVQKSGDAVRVNVQLIKAANDSHLWANSFDRKLTDIFSVETEVARAIADQLRAKLTGREEQVIAAKPTENSEAHQLYLKGRYFWNKRTSDGLATSINYFNQAIEKDPAYGPAYAGLADAYAVLPNYSQTRGKEAYPKAEAAAMKALEIDDELAEAHIALANVRVWHKWARAAEPEFKRGLELNRNYSTGHQWYSIYLSVLGRHNEAISEMEKAQELDPFSIIINTEVGCPYLYSKRYDRAIEYFSKAIQMDPDFPFAHFALAEAYDRTGRFHEALEEHEHAIDLAFRGQAFDLAGGDAPRAWYALAGPLQNAYRALRGATYWQTRLQSAKKSYDEDTATATKLAEIYAILGDKEQALAWLAKAYEQSDDFLVFINIQPQFDKLRSDLRFQALVNKIFQGSVQKKNE
jgi:TolB-like protein